MKKEKLRKLMVLLLVMIMYSVCFKSANVLAASKIILKDGSEAPKTIYTGQTLYLKVPGKTVKFYSKNQSIATIGQSNGELKALAPGNVDIIARSEDNGRVVAKATFVVNQRSTSVAVEEKSLYLLKNETAMIKTIVEPKTSTDVLRFASSDESVATVDMESGEVTAKANGVATITVYAMDTMDTDLQDTDNKTAKVMVYVEDYIKEVRQAEANQLEVVFDHDISNDKMVKSDFKVTSEKKEDVYAIKNIKIDKKENKVILEMYFNFLDGRMYSVTYKNRTVQFKASDGKVTKVVVTPTTISCETYTQVFMNYYDVNGMYLGREVLDATQNNGNSINVVGGFNTENGIWLREDDSYVEVKGVYHSRQYENGSEVGNIETGTIKIPAVSKEDTIAKGLTYTITDEEEMPNFKASDFKQSSIFAIGDESYYIYFYLEDSAGMEYKKYSEYEVRSTDISILKVVNDIADLDRRLELFAMKEGTAKLEIIDKATRKVVTKVPITVLPQRVPTTISIDKTAYVAGISKERKKTESFTVNVLDQYGQKMKQRNGFLTSQIKISDVSKVKNGCSMDQCISVDNNIVTIYTANSPKATYKYKIQYKKLPAVNFTVTYK